MPEYGIEFDHSAVYEGSATLIALLAYPADLDGDPQRPSLHRSLCFVFLQGRAMKDEGWANTAQLIKPRYAFVRERDLAKDLRTLKRRLRDRMIAGRLLASLARPELG